MLEKYVSIISNAYSGYADYLWREITFQYDYKEWWENYFWLLVGVSALFFVLEAVKPWRTKQAQFRKDFWLDFFYMFFNFFLFSLLIYNAGTEVVVNLWNDLLGAVGITNMVAINVGKLPAWAQLLMLFVIKDFIQWWIHRLLHRVPFLWEFHKVHHSVEQMGFAAHLRFHWMENVVYKTIQYVPLAMIGFDLESFFFVDVVAIAIGHWNHANFTLPIGPLKYLFNSPQMHIWHHAHDMPDSHPYGINFALSLSCWDYIFGTAVIPHDGRDIKLGFPGIEEFPEGFVEQSLYGFSKPKEPEGD